MSSIGFLILLIGAGGIAGAIERGGNIMMPLIITIIGALVLFREGRR